MRTLLRSWFFRIFTGGAILGLGIFNLAMNLAASGAPWIYKALSCSVPYTNMIILNLGQAIVAVFLGSEFLKQDKKNDSVEVIYARSMSNSQYILGKTMGVLAVFLLLNIFILLMGIGFTFISNTTSQSILAYFTYPLLISIPTLVFILGLTFFIMVLVNNQAITFILLTGYIALTVFYLNKKAFHLFDYIAYQVPMLYSSITGFASTGEIILHRSIYFVAGLGFIFLTIYKLQRLPQSNRFMHLPLISGMILLAISGMMAYKYLDNKFSLREYRRNIISLNNKYVDHIRPVVDSCKIQLEHKGKTIQVRADLLIHNSDSVPLDTLIFSLNPDLFVTDVRTNSQKCRYLRDLQILRIIPDSAVLPGKSVILSVDYNGSINEAVAFLDMDQKTFEQDVTFEVFRLHKRFSFLTNDYVCLTPEVIWYPLAGTGYATKRPMHYSPDFTGYSLNVKTSPALTVISQGRRIAEKQGEVQFRPEFPLTGISLLAGDYVKYDTIVDSVEYALYAIKGHDYFKEYFNEAHDTIPFLIRDLKKEYEAGLGFNYPFKRLMLAEVPVHFALYSHIYSYASDAIQPEIILCPEKGVLFNSSDFRGRKYRIEKNMKNNNEEALPVVVQTDLFREFIKDNFMAKRGQHFNYDNIVNWHTYSLFPQYFSCYTRVQSDKWPVLSIATETYVSERNNTAAATLEWYEDLSAAEKINLLLQNSTLDEILQKGIPPEEHERRNPVNLGDLIQVKGLSLFNMLSAEYGSEKMDSLINFLVKSHAHKPIPFDELNTEFNKRFHTDLAQKLNDWYVQRQLPGFIVKNLRSYKIIQGESTHYQIRFFISNPENSDGMITLNVEFNDPNRTRENEWDNSFKVDFSKKIFLPAKSSFEIGYVFNSEPARMSVVTNISRNLPNNLIYGFSGFTETRNTAALDTIVTVPFFDNITEKNEFVADNEDNYFKYLQTKNEAFLKSLVNKNKDDRFKYSSIWWWNPPREWKAVLRSEFYGTYVRSAFYTRSGTGERSALWKTVLPEHGMYDVYFYVDKVDDGWRNNNKSTNYNLTVYHDNGEEKINESTKDVDQGWNYLGSWYISADTGKVLVTNRSNGELVFADAIKWVLTK
jgi:hypothetical protein